MEQITKEEVVVILRDFHITTTIKAFKWLAEYVENPDRNIDLVDCLNTVILEHDGKSKDSIQIWFGEALDYLYHLYIAEKLADNLNTVQNTIGVYLLETRYSIMFKTKEIDKWKEKMDDKLILQRRCY